MLRTKKVMAMLLVIAMGLASFSACGKETNNTGSTSNATPEATATSAPASDSNSETAEATATIAPTEAAPEVDVLADIIPAETVELTVYTQLANYSGEQIGWFAQVMLDKFNVKLNIVNEGDGVFTTRMESGNLGDIVVFGNDTDEYSQAYNAGMLWDWDDEDLVETYGSYIYENMAQALEKNRSISDGVLYGFGHNVATSADDHESPFYHPDIRWDLYSQLGYPEVGTLEDYIDVLADMVELCPTSDTGGQTYGVSLFPDWDGDMVMFVKATAALYGYDEFGFGLYDTNTDTYQDLFADNSQYLRCLKFYNQLYQRGLLDPDSMTQTSADQTETYQAGGAFFVIFNWMGSGTYNTEEHLAAGKAMLPLVADDLSNITYGLNVNGGNRVWTIGAKTQYPELCMAIINWLATPEGRMTTEYGPQGVCWDYNADGQPYLTDLGEACKADTKTELTDGFSGTYADGESKINNTTWTVDAVNPETDGETYNYKNWTTRITDDVSAIEADWRNFTGFKSYASYINNHGVSVAPGTAYTTGTKSDELATTWNQVAEAVKSYTWQAIYADTDDQFNALWAEMEDKVNAYGYADCVAFLQDEAAKRAELAKAAKGE